MFCSQCGSSMSDGARFCPKCGQAVVSVEGAAPPPAQTPQAAPPAEGGTLPLMNAGAGTPPAQPPAGDGGGAAPPPSISFVPPAGGPPEKPPRKRSRLPLLLVCVLAAAAVTVGGVLVFRAVSANRAYQEEMSSGEGYLTDGAYDLAVSAYEEALAHKPKDADAALALSKAYLCSGQMEEAGALLDTLALKEADERYALLQQLLALCRMEPDIAQVDTASFPVVTLKLDYTGDFALTAEHFSVSEGGAPREIQSVSIQDGAALVSYLSEDTDVSEEDRTLSLSLVVDGVPFTRGSDYKTPHFEPAKLTLVTTDVSQYPVVKAYFRVEDSASGENVAGLTSTSFAISERVQGGEYLAREVKSVAPLEGNAGLNIGLVADKSDSISTTDMGKVKKVMTEFVNNLHFTVGDRAEVLAFDSIVQQMCYYTDDTALLINGINSMSTDGMTAFYDAVYDGVTHAALQGGARCVIAFTDGMDNVSRHTASEVISYALDKQVPVYIIGVGGSVEADTLRAIAQGTGGRYWFIDDLYDLEEIFSQVYAEQKELYVVEYESDSALDGYMPRELSVKVSGGGHRSQADVSFTPVRSINDSGAGTHTSRYELVKECLSWEAASQKCQEMGGHLATVTSQDEMDQLVALAEGAGVKYVWLGGTTSHDDANQVFGHWVTGEPFSYQAWAPGEPSRVDQDGTDEWYIMLWNVPSLGGWTWNDQRNDPAAAVPTMKDGMAYICEFEH